MTRGQLWVVLSMSMWDCLLIQHDFPAPPPSPPPTLSWFTTSQYRYEQGPLLEPLSWLNCWHDFCVLKTYPLLPPTSRIPFRLTNFSAFSENATFEFLTRFCFNRFGVPLVSNPSLRCFCTQYANDFAKPANPALTLVFPFVQWTVAGGGGGGGMRRGWIYVLTRISHW